MTKEYIVEVENENENTLDSITEALNAFNINAYVYEKEEEEDKQCHHMRQQEYVRALLIVMMNQK